MILSVLITYLSIDVNKVINFLAKHCFINCFVATQ